MGAGRIAVTMAKTLALMENAECAAIGSRSIAKAKEFAQENGIPKYYGSYEELVRDGDLDLIYVATPHSEHAAGAILAIKAGKPVLVEKAFCANAKQAESVISLAEEKGVFLQEALWVRFMPFLATIKKLLADGVIGRPTLLTANLGYPLLDKPRITDPALAGGALLDVGIYPLSLALALFGYDIEKTVSACTYTDKGVDEQDSITLVYKDGKMAILNASICASSDRLCCIHGEEGHMIVENVGNYSKLKVIKNHAVVLELERPPQLTGYEYEIEACRAAIEAGKTECNEVTHAETLEMMKLMDSLRYDWGVRYPFEREKD